MACTGSTAGREPEPAQQTQPRLPHPAETRVLKLIAEDRTSKEIAELLKISTKTVENHRHNICKKLNIYGSHSLLKFAFDHKSYL